MLRHSGHSWQLVAQGKAPVAHAAMLQAGRVMAGTAIDLFESPELLEKAKASMRPGWETAMSAPFRQV